MRYRHCWLTFNGEVYNYVELRRTLERLGHTFRSKTDTEVVLAAYVEWGTECFRGFHGMWGLVLVDTARDIAVLARDRVGIKPLYVYNRDGVIVACSEIKQLFAVPGVRLAADGAAVVRYVTNGYEDPSRTMFSDVTPLRPGTTQVLDLRTGALMPPATYWTPESIEPTVTDRREAAEIFSSALRSAVHMNLRSDVPVGCALSGGLDSSAVAVSVRAAGALGGLHTFSVTFPGERFDERRYAEAVAARTGATAHFVTPTGQELIADLDRFVWTHDEPVRSIAQYAAYALARLTRANDVPVTLNGQGGDEVLSAYWQSYFIWLRRTAVGGPRLRAFGELLGATLPGGNGEVWRMAPAMLRRYLHRRNPSSAVVVRDAFRSTADASMLARLGDMSWREWRLFEVRDFTFPRLLKWDDRNFMAFSVEGRYPLLDHAVIEACLSFRPEALYRSGWTKIPLRDALANDLPQAIAQRKTKVGFESPQGAWLQGPLRPLVDKLVGGESPLWHYFEQESARRLVERISIGASDEDESGQVLLRLLLADRWMEVFGLDPVVD
jgi:asparagine synthase (glutamine-hydrolysing)